MDTDYTRIGVKTLGFGFICLRGGSSWKLPSFSKKSEKPLHARDLYDYIIDHAAKNNEKTYVFLDEVHMLPLSFKEYLNGLYPNIQDTC